MKQWAAVICESCACDSQPFRIVDSTKFQAQNSSRVHRFTNTSLFVNKDERISFLLVFIVESNVAE